ncbi:MAG TPA: cyclic nucleotide-binding domain-containing protein [Polyangiaceae bacterium]
MTISDVTFGVLTDVGKQRDHNEDNYLVDKKLGLYVVCDGMGGHAAGEVASALAIRTFHEEMKKNFAIVEAYMAGKSAPSSSQDDRAADDRNSKVTRRQVLELLETSVNHASGRVHAEAQKDAAKRGMGTTLVAILVVGQQAFVIWVGDSRIYFLREGVLEQLTEDHTVYNELLKRKRLPREEIEKLPQKNAITRAIGVYEHTEPDTLIVDLVAGDRFLLCSDGLSGYFEEDVEDLGRMMSQPDEAAAVKTMIDSANHRGGKDNITAVLVCYGDSSKRDESRARRVQLKREILARMSLFRALNDREILRLLQVVEVVAFKDEDIVIREGDRGEELFIVLTGSVKVKRGETLLATLGPGDHFGEMALVRSQPRSATVVSDLDSELMVVRRSDFFEILRSEHQLAVKLLWQFLTVLGDRLDETNRELGQAREELLAEDVAAEIFSIETETRKTVVRPPPPSLRQPIR